MSYQHIENLYKNQTILLFKECFVLEKIHGSSAHVAWNDGRLRFFAGGVSQLAFEALFEHARLKELFSALGHPKVTVYGEAYGGSQQGMKANYGDKLKFIAFEVLIGEAWLNVVNCVDVTQKLGLEFVAWEKVSTDLAVLDAWRDKPSVQAQRSGCGEKPAEGIVLRPLLEFRDHRGDRIIAKHKRKEFAERASGKDTEVDPARHELLVKAEAIAAEWVTPMRMQHVLDKVRVKLGREPEIRDTKVVITAMTEDVFREAKREIVESKDAHKAIGGLAAKLFHAELESALK